MTVKSLIRPISDKGYSDFYTQKVSPIIDRIFSNGVGPSNYFANQNQTFTWTESFFPPARLKYLYHYSVDPDWSYDFCKEGKRRLKLANIID